jgi:hypothetical protein
MRDYALRRTQRVSYTDTRRRFQSLLWIQFPESAAE